MASAETVIAVQRLLSHTYTKLQASKPRPPLGAFDFFKVSLTREYGIVENPENAQTINNVSAQAWAALKEEEKGPFEAHALDDTRRYAEEQRVFEDMQLQYDRLKALASAQGVVAPAETEAAAEEQQAAATPRYQQQQQQQQQQAAQQQQVQAQAQQQVLYAQQQQAQQQQAQQQQQQQYAQQQLQYAQQQQQVQLAQQQLLDSQRAMAQQAASVHQTQQQLATLQPQFVRQLQQAEAGAMQLPLHLQQVYVEQQRQSLAQQYQQQQSLLQTQLQQAIAAMDAARQTTRQQEFYLAQQQQHLQRWQDYAAQQGWQAQRVQPSQVQVQQLQSQQPQPQQRAEAEAAARRPKIEPGSEEEAHVLPPGVPATIEVSCQGVSGTMSVLAQHVACGCSGCARLPPSQRIMSCPQFEAHTGASNAKKWKTSLKVVPGGAPGVPASGNGMQVGRWLELNNVNFSRPVQTVGGGRAEIRAPAPRQQQPVAEKTYASERLAQKMQERQREAERAEERQARRAAAAATTARGRQALAHAQSGGSDDDDDEEDSASELQLARHLQRRGHRSGFNRSERPIAAHGHASTAAGHPAGTAAGTAKVQPWMELVEGSYQPVTVRFSGERCCVCDADNDYDFDQLVACDLCGITVHQSCYGIMELPGPDEMWLCRACELSEEGGPPPQCCVCPVSSGALKPTTLRGVWCHSACLQWIPELSVADALAQEPIAGVRSIPKERWDLLCTVCRQRVGAKIQCDACFAAYHPLCARVAGYHMETRDGPEGPDGPVQFISYCSRHSKPQPQPSGARLVSESEELGDLPAQLAPCTLDNAQPYALPGKAPLPVCPAGAARAMPIDKWQRQQHGTGTGASSVAAFWIPGAPQVVEGPRKRQRAAGRLAVPQATLSPLAGGSPVDVQVAGVRAGDERAQAQVSGGASLFARHWATGGGGRGGSKGRGRGRGGVRHGGARGGGGGGRGSGNDEADDPPEFVELLPLPPNVPEEVPIVCNGHEALLLVRSQRVLYDGEEIAASRFESLAGKEVAKKWKTSVFYLDSNGQAAQMMQDWLADHSLDHKVLQALARNLSELKAWERYSQQQVADVLNDVVDDVVAAAEDDNGSSAALEQFAGVDGDALAGGTEAADSFHASAGTLQGNGGQEYVEGQDEDGQQEDKQDQRQGQRGGSKLQCSGDGAQLGGQPVNGMLQRPRLEKLLQQEGPECQPNGESQLGAAANGHLSLRADLEMNDGGRSRGSEPAASSQGQEVEVAEYGRSVSPELKSCTPAEHNEGQSQEQQQQQQQPEQQQGLAASLERQEGGGMLLGRKRSFEEACGNSTRSNGSSDSGPANGLRQQPVEAANGADAPLSRSPGSTLIAPTAAAGSDSQQQQHEQRSGFLEAATARAECIGNGTLSQQQQQGQGQHPEVQLEHVEQPNEAQAQQEQQQEQQQQQQQQQQQEEEGPEGSDHGMVVDVMCGRLPARFDARCMLVTLRSGQVVSPIEYERLSGRSQSKKWKWSIRVDLGGGELGMTLEEWLAQRGLHGAAAPRANSLATADAIRQQQLRVQQGAPEEPAAVAGIAAAAAAAAAGRPLAAKPHPSHNPDCGCVVCANSRRNSRIHAGGQGPGLLAPRSSSDPGSQPEAAAPPNRVTAPASGAATAAAAAAGSGMEQGIPAIRACMALAEQQPAYNLRGYAAPSSGGAPRFRDGKRSFLRALPQLATAGPTPHQLTEVPLSRCWTPADWAAHRLRQSAVAAARASGRRLPKGADLPHVVAGGGNAHVDSLAPSVSLGPGVHEGRPLTMKEKLELCNATERTRIAFGKSGIHGWGLFARVPMRQDSMVTEYRGVMVRASVAEARETRYRAAGRDCYLFNLDDQHVLDATQAGAISRFTNHSCSPSLYSKILNVDGRQRLVFFARRDLEVGQELTYNYRFERNEGEERLPCCCGAPACTGFLN